MTMLATIAPRYWLRATAAAARVMRRDPTTMIRIGRIRSHAGVGSALNVKRT